MGDVFLSEVIDRVVNPDLTEDNLKRARGEQTNKLKRAYQIFDIEIDMFKVKGKYYINKLYAKDIEWILYYTSTYRNRDEMVRQKSDITVQSMEAFRNREFYNVHVLDLENIVLHMINGLLAFNTSMLGEEQKAYLKNAINEIYMSTKLHYRKLEYQVQAQFDKVVHTVDDKAVVYYYLMQIIDKVGDLVKQIISEIGDYREAEQIDALDDYFDGQDEIEPKINMNRIEQLVVNSTIDILKEIVQDMEETRNPQSYIEEIELEPGDQGWIKEITDHKVSHYNQVTRYKNAQIKLEQEEKYIQDKINYLTKEIKRKHYTNKKIKDIKQEISDGKARVLQIREEIKGLEEKA